MLIVDHLNFRVSDRTLLDSVSFQLRTPSITCLLGSNGSGKTILLIEHQPDSLQRVGERFLFLESGRLHAFDTLAALRARRPQLT